MQKIENRIQQIEKLIQENHTHREKDFLISEMKKIGIEKLPYSYSALKKFIDSETMNVHYNKHYKGYVDKLNAALSKKKFGDLELEKIIKNISRYDKTIRNNAGGAFNHALFWNMLTPKEKKLKGELYDKIVKEFGTFGRFKKKFENIAKDRFGSGWVWLVITKKNTLKIMSTPNQDNPLMNVIEGGGFPLLGLDLWEHAYYLKYKNKRDEYISNFWKVVNWDFVTKLYKMKTETNLVESLSSKKILNEGKSEYCGDSVPFYRELFNNNTKVKWIFFSGIQDILKDVFNDYWVENPGPNLIPGVYDLEKPGRSGINKLNTNYTCFCVLLKDLNKVITKEDEETPISFENKRELEQIGEARRFVKFLKKYKDRIFRRESSTYKNLMEILNIKRILGIEREQRVSTILRNHFKDKISVEVVADEGSKIDALKGIDLLLTKDGVTKTAQVKPVDEIEFFQDDLKLKGTGNVKMYSVDFMIFEKNGKVLVFRNNDTKIKDGNYIFPATSLIYDIN